jgi:hypothetical protein
VTDFDLGLDVGGVGDNFASRFKTPKQVSNVFPNRDIVRGATIYEEMNPRWCRESPTTIRYNRSSGGPVTYVVPRPRASYRMYEPHRVKFPVPDDAIPQFHFVTAWGKATVANLAADKAFLVDSPRIASVVPDSSVGWNFDDDALAEWLGKLQKTHPAKYGSRIDSVSVYVEPVNDIPQPSVTAATLCNEMDVKSQGLHQLTLLRAWQATVPTDITCLESGDLSCYDGVEHLYIDVSRGDRPLSWTEIFPKSVKSLTLCFHDIGFDPDVYGTMLADCAETADPKGELTISIEQQDDRRLRAVLPVSDPLEISRLRRKEAYMGNTAESLRE